MLTHLWQQFRAPHRRSSGNRHLLKRSGCLGIEPLEERCLMAVDAVIQWNQAVLQAIRVDKPAIGFVTRDLAIVQTAIYDAVNAIDHTSSAFHVRANAPADASPVAAAD